MSRAGCGLFLAIALTGAACQGPSAPAPVVIRAWTVRATVETSGTLDVDEAITATLAAGAHAFARRIASPRVDAFRVGDVLMDGQPMSRVQSDARHVDIQAGRGLDVVWVFPAVAAESHTFTIHYAATGAVEVSDARGRLVWPAIPAARAAAIRQAHIELVIPDQSVLYDPSGIAAAGWTVARTAHGITAALDGVAPADGATILASFEVDPHVMAEADWQLTADRIGQFAPAFVAAGLFILVVGAGVVWIVRFQYPRTGTRDPAGDRERALALTNLWRAGWVSIVLGALLGPIAWALLDRYGLWPQAISGSVVLDGVLFLIAAVVLGRP